MRKADKVGAVVLQDILMLADVQTEVCDVEAWSQPMRRAALSWAAKSHLRASDNSVRVPPKPAFLNKFPGVNISFPVSKK